MLTRPLEHMSISPHDLVLTLRDIASPPEVYFQLNRALESSEWACKDLGAIVEKDASLTARVLKLVNSPSYGLWRQVATIEDAITVVGAAELRNLLLVTALLDVFSGIPAEIVTMRDFWRRSLRCAVVARLIAEQAGSGLNPRWMFVAGLLHDIGSIVVCLKLPELAREALLHQDGEEEMRPFSVECAVLGTRDAAVGRELLTLWKLPELLCRAVGDHTEPVLAEGNSASAATVFLARGIALAQERAVDPLQSYLPREHEAWAAARFSPAALEGLSEEAEVRYEEALGLFGVGVRG